MDRIISKYPGASEDSQPRTVVTIDYGAAVSPEMLGSSMPPAIEELLSDDVTKAAEKFLQPGIRRKGEVLYERYMEAMQSRGIDDDSANSVLHRLTSLGMYAMSADYRITRSPRDS